MSGYEPTDVGPRVGGDQPASDSDRALAINLLNAAASDGRLSVADHQVRVATAQRAQTFDDLIPLTRDLVGLRPTVPANPMLYTSPGGQTVAPFTAAGPLGTAAHGSGEVILGIFGGSVRKGQWPAPAHLTSITVFGGNEIDLTQAIWAEPVIELTVQALFGGVDVKVPPGTKVVNQTIGIFGGADVKGQVDGTAGRCLIVKGFCCFGGVSIKAK